MLIEKARSWHYKWGVATIQLVRGDDGGTDSPVRLWDNEPMMWDCIPKDPAYAGVAEKRYHGMVQEEERCWKSWKKKEA